MQLDVRCDSNDQKLLGQGRSPKAGDVCVADIVSYLGPLYAIPIKYCIYEFASKGNMNHDLVEDNRPLL